ncbi:hypothetical protein GH714_017763 [Hevea brasiliensis]|uniref:Retrotransposon Copia-like N-terminal domain-containing protein n=1 Tax=Hevea brasiliensis TaxID=3981 RepID=A0A6A6MB27_HEVBR|nr:hypothetical protein GH714_017763 [Hevea brasiliensis]
MADSSSFQQDVASGSNVNPMEDTSSPFYLHHFENHSSVIVTPELTSTNFPSWKKSFLLAVSILNKQGFLDGSIVKPSPEDSTYLPWIRCNNLIVAWLLRSISPPIASTVFYMQDAKQIWEKLHKGFPPDFKFSKSKVGSGSSFANSKQASAQQVTGKCSVDVVIDNIPKLNLSKEQVNKLMSLLNDQANITVPNPVSFSSPNQNVSQVNTAVSDSFVSLPNGVKVQVTAVGPFIIDDDWTG